MRMNLPPGDFLVDAHCDIGCHCQDHGRDLLNSTGCAVPVMASLPLWQAAGIRLVCITLFTQHDKPEKLRRRLLYEQYNIYLDWLERYPQELRLIRNAADLDGLAVAEETAVDGRRGWPVGVILLMEGLELVDSPAEMQTWFERGLRLASLTWNGVNHYASGTFANGHGLTPLGVEMLGELERMGIILDLSHLADRGIAEAFERYHGPVCSTHSNARALCNIERNLTDEQAREIARRGGVIGLNLLAPLLVRGWRPGDPQPPLAAATQHSAYLAFLLGAEHTGIGSDLDGGLTPDNTPLGIDTVRDLAKLGRELTQRGWDAEEIAGFNGANWWRFFRRALPGGAAE
jgi:membrane dipeptidase